MASRPQLQPHDPAWLQIAAWLRARRGELHRSIEKPGLAPDQTELLRGQLMMLREIEKFAGSPVNTDAGAEW